MAIQNKCYMRHKSCTNCLYKKVDCPSPTHLRPNAKSLNRSIPSTMVRGPHRRLWYLQPNDQHLHVRTGESMSSRTQ
jgi:hypothetical protein